MGIRTFVVTLEQPDRAKTILDDMGPDFTPAEDLVGAILDGYGFPPTLVVKATEIGTDDEWHERIKDIVEGK